jgi:hypothetical protein
MYSHLPPGDPYKNGTKPELDSFPIATKHLSELEGSPPAATAYNISPSAISPLTNPNNRSSAVSSINASPTQPQGLGLGFSRQGNLYDVPEEAGLGPYAPYRAYRPPLVELAGEDVVLGERTREPAAVGGGEGVEREGRQA